MTASAAAEHTASAASAAQQQQQQQRMDDAALSAEAWRRPSMVLPAWSRDIRFKCRQCDDDKPLTIVPFNGMRLCSTCFGSPELAGMVAGCANCPAIVCLACIDNGIANERWLDWVELFKQLQQWAEAAEAAMPTTAAGSQEEARELRERVQALQM